MGHDISLQLRQHNLMTKIMLKQEQQIIEHVKQSKIDIVVPINQIGDTLMHYAAYNSLKILMVYLLQQQADPYHCNNRGLTPVDVAIPQIRQWLIRKDIEIKESRQAMSPKGKSESVAESTIIRQHMNSQ